MSSPDVDQVVQTLLAQTLVANLNVTLNPATVVINFPTVTPMPIPVFPDEAQQALQDWAQQQVQDTQNYHYSQTVTTSFTIVSAAAAANLRGDFLSSLGGIEEAWCVVTNPPLVVIYGVTATVNRHAIEFWGFSYEVITK